MRGGAYEHLKNLLERQLKRLEIGVPIDAKLLISVGELSTRKNHSVVVEALQKLPENNWYVIVGTGDLKDELMSLDHTGRLKFLGYRTDIPQLLKAADLFVFPSLQEGLPVALMEALASEIPCVVSRIRGNVDLVEDGLFSPEDVDAVERAILEAEHRHSKIRLDEVFAISSLAEKMEELYHNV